MFAVLSLAILSLVVILGVSLLVSCGSSALIVSCRPVLLFVLSLLALRVLGVQAVYVVLREQVGSHRFSLLLVVDESFGLDAIAVHLYDFEGAASGDGLFSHEEFLVCGVCYLVRENVGLEETVLVILCE